MSYYWFNKQKLLQKAWDRYHNCGGKEKAVKYYADNKEVLKEKANNRHRNSLEEEKVPKRKHGKNRYKKKRKKIQAKILIFCIL